MATKKKRGRGRPRKHTVSRFSVSLTEEQVEKVRAWCAITGCSAADAVRAAVRAWEG